MNSSNIPNIPNSAIWRKITFPVTAIQWRRIALGIQFTNITDTFNKMNIRFVCDESPNTDYLSVTYLVLCTEEELIMLKLTI